MVIAFPVFLEQMSGLLPAEKKQVSLNTLPQRERFEILYRLNCDKLFADFHEDMDFKFSWGRSRKPEDIVKEVSMLYIIVSVTGNGLI